MSYIYHLKKGTNPNLSLLVLHGTGGDEFDLLPFVEDVVSDDVTILSLRGNVNEHGQARFFTRYPDGSFDQDDLVKRTGELADFIAKTCAEHGINPDTLYALGYSNGANMIASLLLQYPNAIAGGVLLRSMIPLETPKANPGLKDKNVLVLSGVMDQILPPEFGQNLAKLLEESGANVSFKARLAGHELRPEDVSDTKAWFKKTVFHQN